MKIVILLCGFISCICISCNDKKEAHITHLHEFNHTLYLKGQSNHVESDKYKSPLLAVIDSFLIIYDPLLYNSLLSIHDKFTFRKIADYGFVGRGPGEIAMKGFWHVDADEEIIFIQDAIKKKIFRFSLDSMLSQGNDYFPENDYYVLPDGSKKFIGKFIVDDETIITADNWGAGLLSFFNRGGNLTNEIGRHFLENDGYPIRGYKQLCFFTATDIIFLRNIMANNTTSGMIMEV